MTGRERLARTLARQPVDRPPVGFWYHFPPNMHHGDAAVQGHLDFMASTGTDILKVMNENLLHDGGTKIRSTRDIPRFRGFSRADAPFRDQMDIISRIRDKAGEQYPVIATVHGLVASAFHQTGFAGHYVDMGYGLAIFCRERPEEMKKAFETVAHSLMELVECSLEAGADGIFYAALGGERHFFDDDEFRHFVAPYEKMVYDHIKAKTPLDILHICKSNIALERFAHLRPTVANWSIYQNGVSLTQGAQLFPGSILLGGFQDRSGVLVSGTDQDIHDHTATLLEEMKGKPFILGSDCTLPTEISSHRIAAVVKAAESLTRNA